MFVFHAGNASDDAAFLEAAQHIDANVNFAPCNKDALLSEVKQTKCCDVIFSGHRGHGCNTGGVVAYCGKPPTPRRVLPDPAFEKKLKVAFKDNNCKSCKIVVVSCCSAYFAKPLADIARNTGCIVCGFTISAGLPQLNWPRLDNVLVRCLRWDKKTNTYKPLAGAMPPPEDPPVSEMDPGEVILLDDKDKPVLDEMGNPIPLKEEDRWPLMPFTEDDELEEYDLESSE